MDKKQLELIAAKGRLMALDMVYTAASGHIGGSLSAIDALTVLYFEKMRIDPQNPADPDRDRFVLSKGHCTPALYAVLALRGFFPVERCKLFRSIQSDMSGHPDMHTIPGVDMSTGSLGQGISAAVGMALAGRLDQKPYRVYAMLGDGECQEGQVWEAAMAAGKYHLDNLCAMVDHNGLQIDGTNDEVMPIEPLDKKFEAFNWNAIRVNGHDYDAIGEALDQAAALQNGKPTVLILETVKGKGVSYMENVAGWHGKAPGEDLYKVGRAELEAHLRELEG